MIIMKQIDLNICVNWVWRKMDGTFSRTPKFGPNLDQDALKKCGWKRILTEF